MHLSYDQKFSYYEASDLLTLVVHIKANKNLKKLENYLFWGMSEVLHWSLVGTQSFGLTCFLPLLLSAGWSLHFL